MFVLHEIRMIVLLETATCGPSDTLGSTKKTKLGEVLIQPKPSQPKRPNEEYSHLCPGYRVFGTVIAATITACYALSRQLLNPRNRPVTQIDIVSRVDRTRPLCGYPDVARYDGSGSIDEASNFSCVAP